MHLDNNFSYFFVPNRTITENTMIFAMTYSDSAAKHFYVLFLRKVSSISLFKN